MNVVDDSIMSQTVSKGSANQVGYYRLNSSCIVFSQTKIKVESKALYKINVLIPN